MGTIRRTGQRETELQRSRDRLRDMSSRLLTAQETERARIGRELHDDIGQQVSLLCMELAEAGASDALRERANEIARSVHALSHRLHPVGLQLLGLVGSIAALQREHTRGGMKVALTHHRIPVDLPSSLALCVFRVVQEALHNAARHSHARRVMIDLRHQDSRLKVTIADDGVGFDVKTACGKGLGLINMRERVEAAGGTLVIRSEPGKGSRFEVNVGSMQSAVTHTSADVAQDRLARRSSGAIAVEERWVT